MNGIVYLETAPRERSACYFKLYASARCSDRAYLISVGSGNVDASVTGGNVKALVGKKCSRNLSRVGRNGDHRGIHAAQNDLARGGFDRERLCGRGIDHRNFSVGGGGGGALCIDCRKTDIARLCRSTDKGGCMDPPKAELARGGACLAGGCGGIVNFNISRGSACQNCIFGVCMANDVTRSSRKRDFGEGVRDVDVNVTRSVCQSQLPVFLERKIELDLRGAEGDGNKLFIPCSFIRKGNAQLAVLQGDLVVNGFCLVAFDPAGVAVCRKHRNVGSLGADVDG